MLFYFCLDKKETIDWLLKFTPIIISISVAIIGWFQYKINKNKIRLDLYNRRFAVFDKILNYYLAYYSTNLTSEKIQGIEKDFVCAYRESLFLFGRESSVYKIITEIKDDLGFLFQFKEKFGPLPYDKDEYRAWSKTKEEKQDPAKLMKSLEDALASWLDFQKIEK